ncbi:hypothetical protein, partial [Clostridium botulinum]
PALYSHFEEDGSIRADSHRINKEDIHKRSDTKKLDGKSNFLRCTSKEGVFFVFLSFIDLFSTMAC